MLSKQFCLHGHDVFVTGRTKWGNCIACCKERQREQTAARQAYREARRPVPHGVTSCACEMCEDRRFESFMDTAHAQWEEAAWEARA